VNTYFVVLQKNAEIPPQEFYCDASKPGHAINAALNQIAPCDSVVVACHLYASDIQVEIDGFEVMTGICRGASL